MIIDFLHLAVLAALILIPALYFFRAFAASEPAVHVALCGPSEAGKTGLLLQLVRGEHVESQTSQAANQVSIQMKNRAVSVVDTPGNLRLLSNAMKYIEAAKSLVFVVDSADKQSFKTAAQQLVDIALNAKVIRNRPDVLFVANKSDLLGARDPDSVLHFVQLEAERILKAYKSESHMKHTSAESMTLLNNLAQDNFSIHSIPLHISLCAASVKQGNISQVISFIEQH